MSLAIAGLGATSAVADPVGGAPTAGATTWAVAPSYADVLAAYPARARASRQAGHAVIFCDFALDGRLSQCIPVSEAPLGEGFADAARKLARDFRADVSTEVARQKTLGGGVSLAVVFDPAMLDQARPVLGTPKWTDLPSAMDVDAAFAGTPKNVGAVRVVLDCKVQQGGVMGGCGVESEQPAGQGFGQAALALAAKTRVSTWTDQGLPVVGGAVRIPIRFETGAPAPAGAPPAAKP
ncbi:MAG TPA: hypothetical protein VHV27_11370 [Phenylobacterium sp.]|nr:hypothetical protein [Phenylobacterium sp.]